MATHTLTVEDWHPPLANAFIGRHWSIGHRLKRAAAQRLALEALAQRVPVASGRRRLRMVVSGWARGGRICDADAPLKAGLDSLVRCGLLLDDGPAGLEGMPLVEVVRGPKRTIITLEDVQEDTP